MLSSRVGGGSPMESRIGFGSDTLIIREFAGVSHGLINASGPTEVGYTG